MGRDLSQGLLLPSQLLGPAGPAVGREEGCQAAARADGSPRSCPPLPESHAACLHLGITTHLGPQPQECQVQAVGRVGHGRAQSSACAPKPRVSGFLALGASPGSPHLSMPSEL